MSQRGIRIKLLISDGKITIPRTKHPFEFATKNFVKTTKNPVYELHEQSRFTGNHTNTTRCGRRQAAIKRNTDAVEHRCWNTPEGGGACRMRSISFRIFRGAGGGELRPSAGRTSPAGTRGDRPSSARKAPPGSRRSPCPRQGSSGALCKAESGRPDKITDEAAAIPPLSASAPAIRVSVPA